MIARRPASSILSDAFNGIQLWGELFEVPLMCGDVPRRWSGTRAGGRRRCAQVEAIAEMRASLLERQERFLHDASHELRTPVTIARGHLELLRREEPDAPELAVALDELERIERIVDRLLLLAKAEQPDFVVLARRRDRELPRGRLHALVGGRAARRGGSRSTSPASCAPIPEALRNALDALLENAVKYTEPHDAIDAARRTPAGGEIVIEVADEGCGVPPEALDTDLRPLRARGRRADARAGRRGARALDRRRDREGARRPLHG